MDFVALRSAMLPTPTLILARETLQYGLHDAGHVSVTQRKGRPLMHKNYKIHFLLFILFYFKHALLMVGVGTRLGARIRRDNCCFRTRMP